jgi:hypothetical protein
MPAHALGSPEAQPQPPPEPPMGRTASAVAADAIVTTATLPMDQDTSSPAGVNLFEPPTP